MKNFLSLWTNGRMHDDEAGVPVVSHVASEQYGRVSPGDRVWLVTVRGGRLISLGQMLVGRRVNQRTAAKALGKRPSELWRATHHLLPDPGTASPAEDRDVTRIAGRLRFVSTTSDRLKLIDGRVDPKQLQTMRELTEESATLLGDTTTRAAPPPIEARLYPDEIHSAEPLVEGAVRRVAVNAYERSRTARRKCVAAHGTRCAVCEIQLSEMYAGLPADFVHVHHLRPIARRGDRYVVDPIKDLRPVCPNCHAVIHSQRVAYSIDEVRAMLRRGDSR